MEYNNMTKEELILELQKKDKIINKLKQEKNNEETSVSTTKPITFKIINFNEDDSWLYIELLWTNKSSRNIHFIEGTLKFYDSNGNLLCVDNKHICSGLNAFGEKAEVIKYLKRNCRIPKEASRVEIKVANIYYM